MRVASLSEVATQRRNDFLLGSQCGGWAMNCPAGRVRRSLAANAIPLDITNRIGYQVNQGGGELDSLHPTCPGSRSPLAYPDVTSHRRAFQPRALLDRELQLQVFQGGHLRLH